MKVLKKSRNRNEDNYQQLPPSPPSSDGDSDYAENKKGLEYDNVNSHKNTYLNSRKNFDEFNEGGSTFSNKLSKIYPNLCKNILNKKQSIKSNTENIIGNHVECFTCQNEVLIKFSELRNHLLFGPIKCIECGWLAKKCSKFLERDNPKHNQCPHNLQWVEDPVMYLKKEVKMHHDFYEPYHLKKYLKEYILSLKLLWEVAPWISALDLCRIDMHITMVNFTSKKDETNVKNVDLPDDGRYLILRDTIEECPNCYTKLCPERFDLNYSTSLISTKCSHCRLPIYFVFTPPDGEIPLIEITH